MEENTHQKVEPKPVPSASPAAAPEVKTTPKPAKKSLTSNPAVMIVAAVVVIIVIFSVYSFATSSQTVQSGDNVSVYYKLSFTNGTVFQSNFGGQPFTFTTGANEVIPGFDQAVIGMQINQTKNVTIPVNDAYGPENPALVMQVPVNDIQLGANQTVKIGMTLTRDDNGQEAQGIVTSIANSIATVDFNSPLAGKTLDFTIKVLAISKS